VARHFSLGRSRWSLEPAYHRHLQACPHKRATYRHCTRPAWVDGSLTGWRVRKSLETRNWKHAEKLVLSTSVGRREPEAPISTADACEGYLEDAKVRRLRAETLRKNTRTINRVAAAFGERSLRSITVSDLRDLRAKWKFSPITMRKNIEIMRAFFAFCVESGWVTANPAKAVKPPTLILALGLAVVCRVLDKHEDESTRRAIQPRPGGVTDRDEARLLTLTF